MAKALLNQSFNSAPHHFWCSLFTIEVLTFCSSGKALRFKSLHRFNALNVISVAGLFFSCFHSEKSVA